VRTSLILGSSHGRRVGTLPPGAPGCIHDLNDARRDRLVDAKEGLPALLWVVLLLGGVIVVGFTYLFGLDNTLVHTLMVGRWRR
jgi:hypothetical protein